MSEANPAFADTSFGDIPNATHVGGGAILRAAREAQGIRIATLAATLKVPESKLEALEAERLNELPDATFARALAKTVCRALKIDPRPVLAGLPSAGPRALDSVEGGLNTPFRDHPGRGVPLDASWIGQPMFWVVALLLCGAVAVSFAPPEWLRFGKRNTASASSTTASPSTATGAVDAASPAGETVINNPAPMVSVASGAAAAEAVEPNRQAMTDTAPATPAAASAVAISAPAPAAASASAVVAGVSSEFKGLRIRAAETSYVRVREPDGRILLDRLVKADEVVDLDVKAPLRVRLGNVHGTTLQWQGQSVDTTPFNKNNLATVDLN